MEKKLKIILSIIFIFIIIYFKFSKNIKKYNIQIKKRTEKQIPNESGNNCIYSKEAIVDYCAEFIYKYERTNKKYPNNKICAKFEEGKETDNEIIRTCKNYSNIFIKKETKILMALTPIDERIVLFNQIDYSRRDNKRKKKYANQIKNLFKKNLEILSKYGNAYIYREILLYYNYDKTINNQNMIQSIFSIDYYYLTKSFIEIQNKNYIDIREINEFFKYAININVYKEYLDKSLFTNYINNYIYYFCGILTKSDNFSKNNFLQNITGSFKIFKDEVIDHIIKSICNKIWKETNNIVEKLSIKEKEELEVSCKKKLTKQGVEKRI